MAYPARPDSTWLPALVVLVLALVIAGALLPAV